MSHKTSIDQYGRKTWDVEAYAEEARAKRQRRGPDAGAEPVPAAAILARDQMIESLLAAVQEFSVVSGDANRHRVGFACPVCRLLFRDDMALVDHFNLPQHLARVGKDGNGFTRSTYTEVAAVLGQLVREKTLKEKQCATFQERVARRIAFETKMRDRRRRKRSKQITTTSAHHDHHIMSTMGFSSFGTQSMSK